jgi:hypothetical protein
MDSSAIAEIFSWLTNSQTWYSNKIIIHQGEGRKARKSNLKLGIGDDFALESRGES